MCTAVGWIITGLEESRLLVAFCALQVYRPSSIYYILSYSAPPHVQQPLLGQDLLIIESSPSHSDTSQSVGLLWTSDQPNAEISDITQHSQQTSMPLEGFEPTIQASERPQTRTLGRAATGIALLYSLRFRTICPPQPRGVILAASNTVRVAHFLYPTRCRVDPFSYFVPNTGYPNRYLWNVLSP